MPAGERFPFLAGLSRRMRLAILTIIHALCVVAGIIGCAPLLTPEEQQARNELLEKLRPWRQEQRDRLNFIGLALQDRLSRPSIIPVLMYAGVAGDRIDAGCTGDAIALFEGMVRFLSDDDELAFVIAHEMAHCFEGRGSWARTWSQSPVFSQSDEERADAFALAYLHEAGFDIDTGVETLVRLSTEVPRSMTGLYFVIHPHSLGRIARAKEGAAATHRGTHPATLRPLRSPVRKVTFAMTAWVDLTRVSKESRWVQRFDHEMRAFADPRFTAIETSKQQIKLAEEQGDPAAVERARKESETLTAQLQEEIATKRLEILTQTNQPFHRAIVQVTREGMYGDPNARLADLLDRSNLKE
ncbi:hypothetical protein W02_01000 [Nitrospira sp. KM1]|nr:hypothetical protein W02_01000 [Nitrospira sp. KM1]